MRFAPNIVDWQHFLFLAVVLENHEVTDEDVEPALKRQRIEINCQDPSIKVVIVHLFIGHKVRYVLYIGENALK